MSKLLKAFGIVCIILAGVLFWQRNNPKRVTFLSAQIEKETISGVKKNVPTRLIIKNADIDLEIFSAKINGQRWETTTLGVSWLDISPIPGEKGNSIIYGHNWTNLLGNLIKVQPGNEIEIVYKDGSSKYFTVENTAKVSAKNVSVLNQTTGQKITIYTCVGLFDENRLVVVGTLIKNSAKK